MAVRGFDFQGPRFQRLQAPEQVTTPSWGPPDMAALLMKGISGIGEKFGAGFEAGNKFGSNQRVNQTLQDVAAGTPAQQITALGQPGGPYAGGEGTNTQAGGTGGGINPRSMPSFAQSADGDPSAAMLREFEGKRTTPYWDVNAYRVGYGSDTITDPETGAVRQVRKGDTITDAQAEADLARRIPEFQQTAAKKVPNFAQLPPNVRGALTSVTYNYGDLPDSVAAAAATGDPNAIAAAVEGLKGHNGGVNAKRRMTEAAFIRGGGTPQQAPAPASVQQQSPAPAGPIAAPQGQQLTYDEQVAEAARTGQPKPVMPNGETPVGGPLSARSVPLSPSPQDAQAAQGVVQAQRAQMQQAPQTAAAAKTGTFLGVPTAITPPGTPLSGGSGAQMQMPQEAGGPVPPQNPADLPAPGAQPAQGFSIPQGPDQLQRPAPPMPLAPPQAPQVPPQVPAPPRPAGAQYRPPVEGRGGGLDPRLISALGWAIQSGDSGSVSGVQTAVSSALKGIEARGYKLHDIGGQPVLYNEQTTEMIPLGGGAAAKAPEVKSINGVDSQWDGQRWVPLSNGTGGGGQVETILQPGDPRRAAMGIPDGDSRPWRLERKANGVVSPTPIANETPKEDKTFIQTAALAKEALDYEPIKNFVKAQDGIHGVRAAFNEGNGPSDMIGIVHAFKTIDPGSTVTGNESASLKNSGGVPAQLQGIYNHVFGGGKLTAEMRAQVYNSLRSTGEAKWQSSAPIIENYRTRAQEAGLNPDRVIPFKKFEFQRAKASDFPDRDEEGNPVARGMQGADTIDKEKTKDPDVYRTPAGGAFRRITEGQ